MTATNRAPVVTNPGDRSGNENDSVAFAMSGSDPDGDPLTWSAVGLPDGLSIDPVSGVISGTLSYSSAGTHPVTVRATDPDLLFDEAGFTWEVADVNQGPQVVDPGQQTASEGDPVSVAMTATDPEGDDFTWSATGLPSGLSIDPISGVISGVVGFGAAPGSPYHSVITATDDGVPSASGAALVDWTVLDVNQAPVVTNPGAQASVEGDPVTLPVAGNDPDGNTLTWSATGLPAGLSITAASGTISGIVDYSASTGSPHAVVVTATDDGVPVLATQVAFSWTITDVNRTPVVTDPGNQTDAEGDPVLLAVSGTDPDGDILTWTAAGLPAGLSIDPSSGEISGILTYASAGTHPVAVRATDDGTGNLFHEVAFPWSVANTNRAPAVSNPGAQADIEGSPIALPVTASDPDADGLVWSASGLPDGLSIDPGTGVIGGTIAYTAAAGSPFAVTVRAADDAVPSLFDEASFAWSVTNVNRAPTVTSPGDQVGAEGDAVGLPITGGDPDGDVVAWSASGLPPGLGIDSETGELIGSIGYSGSAGSPFLVTVRITDQGGLFEETSFGWTVTDTSTVIGILKTSDVVGRAQPGDTIEYTIVVTNPEATPATGLMVSDVVPAGTTYVPGSGTYSMVDAARDSFESGGYGGDDGTIPWSGPWVELDGSGPDATADGVVGSPFCAGGSCLFVKPDFSSGTEGMERSVDLSGYASATLNYRAARSSGGGSVAILVSGNGLPWTTLATYDLTTDDPVPGSDSFDISAFAGADTTIKVETLVAGGGRLYVDDLAVVTGMLNAPAGPPPGLLSGLTLAPGESVTVSFSVVVSDPPPGSGTIVNTATVVSAEEPGGVSDVVSDQVNRYPVFAQDLGDRTDAEGAVVSLSASATDPDGDTRTWSATGLPAGLGIDPATGLISGTVDFDAAPGSPYSVLVIVEDVDGLQDLDSFTWTVSNTNRPPLVVDPGSQSGAEGDSISLPMAGSDPDGNGLTWSATGLPNGLSIDPGSGAISGAIGYDASPGSPFTVTVRATDDGSPSQFHEVVFLWTVADTNRAPTLIDPGAQNNAEGDAISLAMVASDPDPDTLTWTAFNLPPGLIIGSASGVISGTLTFDAASSYTVTVRVTDDRVPFLFDEVTFSWDVANTNRAPALTNPGPRSSAEGDLVALLVVGSDPDGNTLVWSASGLPAGLSLDPATGLISGTIGFDAAPASPFSVTVRATDDGVPVLFTEVAFSWTVADTNRAPMVASPGDRANGESDVIFLPIPASDPDGDLLTWSATGLPPGLSIDAVSGVITGMVSFDAAAGSPYAVTVTVTDDRAPVLSDQVAFSWVVANTNRAPIVTPIAPQDSDEGDAISLAIIGADADGNAITWSATGLPGGLTIDPGTGIIGGTISFEAAPGSPFTVMVTATDDGTPSLWTTIVITWTVADVNRAPTLVDPGAQSTAEGNAVDVDLAATDPDDDTLTWSASGLPEGLVIDSATGRITGTIPFTAAAGSPYAVMVTVIDDREPN
ncbi:MAG: putative Ig domain-containing protein, partial [Acidimicrobiia bacterium]|nr:putative Ig domain-containing protein [Acidimicrobiia bacterium]